MIEFEKFKVVHAFDQFGKYSIMTQSIEYAGVSLSITGVTEQYRELLFYLSLIM